MIKCQTDIEVEQIKHILSKRLNEAFYMYVDLCKYGCKNNDLDFYYEKNDNGLISWILMRYANTFQVFTNSNSVPKCIVDFVITKINENNSPIITGSDIFIKAIYLKLNGFEYSSGYNYEVYNYPKVPSIEKITIPTDEELYECADLILTDDVIGGFYERDILAQQLIKRRKEGFGRNIVIKKDNKIIGHIATYAEFAGVAITSGMIVHKDYRDKPYGFCLESKLMNDLLEEGFRVLCCLRTRQRIKLFDSLNITDRCITSKLLRS